MAACAELRRNVAINVSVDMQFHENDVSKNTSRRRYSTVVVSLRTGQHCVNLKKEVCLPSRPVKAKFHYASWFEACSKLVRAEIWPII